MEGTRIGEGLGVFIRWAIPMSPLVAGLVVYLTAYEVLSGYPLLGGFGVWLLIYFSSAWGRHNRGWHDKAAGTIVVVGGELAPVEPGDPDRSPPSGGQDPTKRAPDSAASEAGTQDEKSSYGLVSDYYSPIRERPPPDRDDTQT